VAREYVVPMANVTVTSAVSLAWVFVNPGTTCTLEFLRAWASQSANATSAQQSVQIATQVTAFPTLTGVTPAKTKFLDPVSAIVSGTAGAAGTSGVNASVAGAGAKSGIITDNFNVLNGYLWVPTPAETLMMNAGASSGLGLYAPTQPTTLTSWSAGLTYRELG
jgi:hypothetical protein